jgi:preprotein translocase subunit SecE
VKKFIQFCKECVAELKKVIWPGRDDVINQVKVVVVSIVVLAAILGLADLVLLMGVQALF